MSLIIPHFHIHIDDPHSHLFNITLKVSGSKQSQSVLSLPSWIPGSYMIRDFAKNIVSLSVSGLKGQKINVDKIDKQNWLINNNNQGYEVNYSVYAYDTSVRTAYLDQFRGFINGTSAFLKVDEFANTAHKVNVYKPDDCPDWQLACGLTRTDNADTFDFGGFTAPNYLELIDYPFEMSDFSTIRFDVYNIPHYVILSGKHNADLQRIADDLTPICQHHLDYFQSPYPVKQYLFMVNIVGDGFGGLEHMNSTALLCSRDNLPTHLDKEDQVSDKYQTFLSLCSHEYFHTWNVKRIKPSEFLNPDLSQETYTHQLWFYEGITSYIDDWSLNQSGIIKPQQYLDTLAKALQRLQNCQGRFVQSTIESSFDAWTKFYKQDENATNAIVSYYVKGTVAALCFDLHLRQHSAFTLKDIMREFWQRFTNGNAGTQYQSFLEVVQQITGLDLSPQFEAWLEGTEDIPIADYLQQFGVSYQHEVTKAQTIDLGMNVKAAKLGISVVNTVSGGIAMQAGISASDNIVAINHLQINQQNWQSVLSQFSNEDVALIHAFRRDELFQTELNLSDKAMASEIKLSLVDPAKASFWLKGT